VKFNVMAHKLVPEHRLLDEAEAKEVLEKLRITKDQLPKVRRSDPAIHVLERVHGPVEEGSIVQVTRLSETAGVSVAYRLVVER
jgi:DNA-directed RNA polymerase subunit H (RpoH/RPB5)